MALEPRPCDARWVAHCVDCQLALTLGVLEIPGTPCTITEQDGADGLPPGLFFRARTDDVWSGVRPGAVVIHRGDMLDLRASGQRSGCCGPTGSDGPNLACACGRVVATEVADCWTPRFVFFEPDAITMVPDGRARTDVVVHGFHPGPGMRDAWPFHAWMHEALAATDWFGDDIAALVNWWLAEHTGALSIVFHDSEPARSRGVPTLALAQRIRGAQPEARSRRCVLVLV